MNTINHTRFFFQSSVLHSQPKSTVGTPAYIAPEVLARKEYDGKVSPVFARSCFLCCVHGRLARVHVV